jgi:hypothetical protein
MSRNATEGILFRAEAVLALLTALALILSARRLSLLLGFVVSASALTLMPRIAVRAP